MTVLRSIGWRSTREVGCFIDQHFEVSFASRSGLVALLHRLGFVHRKPAALSGKMDLQQQRRFIAAYESLLNQLPADEMVMFADAVHPVHGARPVGCWVRPDAAVAVEQKTGRDHLNIHGAPGQNAASGFASCRPTARISIRSSGCGARCTRPSPTTDVAPHCAYSRPRS